MSHKLLVLTRDNQAYYDALAKHDLPQLTVLDDSPNSVFEANIWLAEPKLAAPLLAHASKLVWMQSTFAGVDALMNHRRHTGYQLTNIKNLFGPMMSEYVFGHVLALYRHHTKYSQLQRNSHWQALPLNQLRGKRLVLLGTGDIGQHLCNTAHQFGVEVVGVNRTGRAQAPFDVTLSIEQLDTVLPSADLVVCVLPSTDETVNLFNKHRLQLLKPGAIFVNVGRGDLVDEQALILHLSLNPTSHAILDVFKQEPLPEDNPLWKCQNAILTPHVAAPSTTEDVVQQFVDNYHRFISEQPLSNRVSFALGY
ncbi:D-2-hydroxyacid dehydrogenase [Paraferrimonas sedimenticola]|uniref:Dihydrofolate reductase n=1 Tax=Paraferrimonas sedimenticola TaxID=375674 RepID=A0AA37VUA7_9GAMM|nr:D-2-hydroxyacid dehydrogenase [Paraferrimonas sedimenticola]GLP95754.1 dihydrofolate reductase [Paraferrimonas sedimenticola]